MTLRIHVAPHPDALVAMLCERLIGEPLDPFTPEIVAVPTRGIERWLTQRIGLELAAVAGGIAAHVDFPSPHALVRSLVEPLPDLAASLSAWEGPALQTVVMACVDDHRDEPWMALLRRHLASPAVSRMAAASKITRLFSNYARRRPEMVAAWAKGEDVGPDLVGIGEHHRWQPHLWREVRTRIGVPAPSELIPTALEPIRAGSVNLPDRVSVYGLTGADPFDLAVLAALAETRDVLVHVLHPSPHLWNDLSSDPPAGRDAATARAAHPLLAAWGRHSRELQLVLGELDPQVRMAEPATDRSTLLGRVQADIRANREPGRAEADDSIQIHVCHGARRQVEVLRDAILHILSDDPTLEPRDIVIMTPDLATFAPLLEAGFPQGEADIGLPDLRVRIADRSPSATNPLVRFAVGLLALVDGRLDATVLRELVTRPLVQQRFGFDGEGARSITSIIDDATVAWGLDAEHREWWGVKGVADRTWSRGLERAVAGVFYDDSPVRVVGGVAPLDGVEGQDARPVGVLAAILDRVAAIRRMMAAPMPMSAWATAIGDATRALADPGWDGEWQWTQLERLLAETFPDAGEVDPPVSLAEARRAVAAWADDRPSPLHFRTGDVTVCTLAPMRSVPYRVVCLLGMDDQQFPRTTRSDGDDLLVDHQRLGDHDRSGEDRQLLLDALMAAGDRLVITYSGRDEITNAVYPPSVPIAELLDVLSEMTGRPQAELETRHPLQSFSEAVFTDGALGVDGPWGFDPMQLAGAVAVQNRRQLSLVMQRDWAGSDPPAVVRLDDLIRFLVNPAQGFARASLGFGIPAMPELPDDALPVRMDPLAGWGLKARLLDGLAGGHELEALIARERGADRLPPGSLAEIEIDRARRDVTELWTAAVARGFHQPHHQWIRGRVEVAGRLVEGAVQADPVECHVAIVTPSRMKASHRLRVLIEMAFLAAVDPDRDWHGLVLARRPSGRGLQETVIAGFGEQAEERRAEALDVLAALVGIYDDGHRAPLPLPCETGLAWHRNAESSRSKAFREAAAGFEGGFNPERDDAAFRLLFADVSSMSQLLDTGFEELSARLWGLAVPRLKERGA